MATSTSTGHNNNLSSFFNLYRVTQELGAKYNPTNPLLKTENLEKVYIAGRDILENVNAADIANTDAIKSRSVLFGDVVPFAVRIVNIYSVSGADGKSVENVRSILRKMHGQQGGRTAVATKAPEATDAKTRISSQLGYEDKASHFSLIGSIVEANPSYQVNEAELTKESIAAFASKLRAANEKCIETDRTLETARIERDRVLYTNEDSLLNVFKDVKVYIKAAFGNTSQEYKRISGLDFRNMMK